MEEEIQEQQEQESYVVDTKGKWQPFEAMTGIQFEVGKTYKIKVAGDCLFEVSADRPTAGMITNEIIYTKDNNTRLWIKTGGN